MTDHEQTIIQMTDDEKTLIQTLRQEAQGLKECYTRFSFQALAFGTAVLGIIARYQPYYPFIALASIAVILFLIIVPRIGTYKYGSANRGYGYELHLYRTKGLPDSSGDGWRSRMREIGWEEAMRAWRVVQATSFRHLYYSHRLVPNFLRWKHRNTEYQWFNPSKLVVSDATYYTGSYLDALNIVLHVLAGLATIPLMFMTYQLNASGVLSWTWGWLIPTGSVLFVGYRFVKDRARRRVLETGLLSIHSCAIMWQAVVVAHYRAIEHTRHDDHQGYRNYTKYLSKQAHDLTLNIYDIHEWVA